MAARLIKVTGLAILVVALSAPLASAMRYAGDAGSTEAPAATYLNTPALDQGMQSAVVAPNDKAGTQGIGQVPADPIGMGGQYGLNLIHDGQGSQPSAAPLVIPYLSHGVGISGTQFAAPTVRPDDRAGVKPSEPTTVVTPVSTGDDFSWDSAGFGAAGFAALALAIVLLVGLARRGRNTDVAVS